MQNWKQRKKLWGIIYSSEKIKPDPAKVDAPKYITAPMNKDELISFLYMMQSNSGFIVNFVQKAATLRELTHQKAHFRWQAEYQNCFEDLSPNFKKDTLLRYFDLKKKIFAFADANISGLGAILAQGEKTETAKPIVIVS